MTNQHKFELSFDYPTQAMLDNNRAAITSTTFCLAPYTTATLTRDGKVIQTVRILWVPTARDNLPSIPDLSGGAVCTTDSIMVSEKIFKTFDKQELTFIIGHELAHFIFDNTGATNNARRQLRTNLLSCIGKTAREEIRADLVGCHLSKISKDQYMKILNTVANGCKELFESEEIPSFIAAASGKMLNINMKDRISKVIKHRKSAYAILEYRFHD